VREREVDDLLRFSASQASGREADPNPAFAGCTCGNPLQCRRPEFFWGTKLEHCA
jgi:hypothetical protein